MIMQILSHHAFKPAAGMLCLAVPFSAFQVNQIDGFAPIGMSRQRDFGAHSVSMPNLRGDPPARGVDV
ncbi:hypothetical protein EI42_05778 [Thermosporothrix hazakensis]|jgi:hypothetical protein|uniref:Uncharacterized protein n=2 Tax=Thermosporothrix TaxID=768650 RepID=A0A326TVR6_THEHA|nr:hypothetical protein [Thermosporothrix hazakensis]PZW21016.1 hypothetical protein EI42_05778 [Thermosporothrix hazakensis]BBH91154.1 hypothetical protein KTC_59050 [Thermosporothrix sp. COM3]GCE49299.1 hypothetical protein KTH_41680 [Thermosporothrix hazakensis]